MARSEGTVRGAWAAGIRPEVDLLVSEWADKNRRLPQKSSAEPGAWRTARTPYLREIMDSMSASSPIEDVVFMKGAQLGGTEAILNCLGYMIEHSPGPAMIVEPTVELAKRFSRQRVDPLFTATPSLVGKVAEVASRDSANSMLSKEYMGGILIITGANSAVGLRSMPARWLLLDEIDAYPAEIDEEGSPIDLAEARQRTFARRKTVKVSTPLVSGVSAIAAAYDATDQRRYHVPCPACGVLQVLEFKRLTWSKLGLPPSRAVYVCRECDFAIAEHHKTEMLARGEWIPANPGADPRVRGYHLSALYSPIGWLSWGEIAEKFLEVHKNPQKFRVFTNTVLAETWTERGEAPEWERLYARREPYLGSVPRGALFLTAGADVQKDRIVYEVVGWGRGKTSWSIDYGVLPGDTADLEAEDGPWKRLDALLARSFAHEDGAALAVRMLAVDSGFNTQTVYTWARRYPMSRVIAVKGQPGGALIGSPSPVDITLRGKRPIFGYKVWPVCGGIAKSELYGWLKLEAPEDDAPYPEGWCHFPELEAEYFKQLTAEQLVTHKTKAGFMRLEWELIPGRENHVLDARVYARAAAALAGLDRASEEDWAALEAQLTPPAAPSAGPKGGDEPPPAPAPRRGGWLGDRGRGGWLKRGR